MDDDNFSTHADEPIPRLPRSAGFKLTGPEIFRILLFAALLFGVLVLRKPCSEGVGRFVESFDADAGPTDAQTVAEQPSTHSQQVPSPRSIGGFVRITSDMSEEQIRAKLESVGVSTDDGHRPIDAGTVDANPTDAGVPGAGTPNATPTDRLSPE